MIEQDYDCDLLIVGGGHVGMALACGAADLGLLVRIIDHATPPPFAEESNQLLAPNVVALNHLSEVFLRQIGAWESLVATPYDQMHFWSYGMFSRLTRLHADDIGRSTLGHIVALPCLKHALGYQVRAREIPWICSQGQIWDGAAQTLSLANGELISPRLLIGCDGKNSWLRNHLNIPLESANYQDESLIAVISHTLPHENTARQCFSPSGPIALLPLASENYSALIWTTPGIGHHNEPGLLAQLESYFPTMGLLSWHSPIGRIPIKPFHAAAYHKNHALILGDAAHALHPMAGLGLNLGLREAWLLLKALQANRHQDERLLPPSAISTWAQKCRGYNQLTMDVIARLRTTFNSEGPLASVAGFSMAMTCHFPPLKRWLIQHATGLD